MWPQALESKWKTKNDVRSIDSVAESMKEAFSHVDDSYRRACDKTGGRDGSTAVVAVIFIQMSECAGHLSTRKDLFSCIHRF